MIDRFYGYLVDMGLKEYTSSGRKSTVYSYCNRIEKICAREGITIGALPEKIDELIRKYDIGGAEEKYGISSSRTPINTLKAYKDFLCQNV